MRILSVSIIQEFVACEKLQMCIHFVYLQPPTSLAEGYMERTNTILSHLRHCTDNHFFVLHNITFLTLAFQQYVVFVFFTSRNVNMFPNSIKDLVELISIKILVIAKKDHTVPSTK